MEWAIAVAALLVFIFACWVIGKRRPYERKVHRIWPSFFCAIRGGCQPRPGYCAFAYHCQSCGHKQK